MTQQVNPGDVKIYKIVLLSKNDQATLDITFQVKNISIYESIYSPTVFCELLCQDGIDLVGTFPIIGEEFLEISFKTPGVDDIVTYKFETFKVRDKSDLTNNNMSTYVIEAASAESVKNIKMGKLNTAYTDTITNIVSDLLVNQVETKKPVYVEKTKGISTITIPNLYRLQAIDFLRNRAVSAEVPNSSFVFYENQRGFHFRTIESLLYSQRDDYGWKEFVYDNSSTMEDKRVSAQKYRNIIVLQKNNIVDSLKNAATGAYKNVVEAFDIITKQVVKTEFDFTKAASQVLASDKTATPFNTQSFFSEFKQLNEKPKTMFVPSDSSKPNEFLPENIGFKHAFNSLFGNISNNVLVYGDSTLTVGETIKLSTTDITAMSGNTTEEQRISGMYIITSLRHLITPGPEGNHYVAMQIQKMGYSK